MDFDPTTAEGRRAMERFAAQCAGYMLIPQIAPDRQSLQYVLLSPDLRLMRDGEVAGIGDVEDFEWRESQERAWADLPAWADDDEKVREILGEFDCHPRTLMATTGLVLVAWRRGHYTAEGPTYAAAAMEILCRILSDQLAQIEEG